MTLLLQGISLERLQRDALLVLHAGMPVELERLEGAWSGMDSQLSELLGEPELEPCTLEVPVVWFPGHRKSALKEPIERYPLITTMAYQLAPKPTQLIDQAFEGTATLFVEGFVKGDTQGVVNRRVQRTVEAANNVLVRSTLNGTVSEVPMPDVLIGDEVDRTIGTDSDGSFADGSGEVWWFQGFRLQYRLPTVHAVPERQVGATLPPDGIDTLMVPTGG